MQKSPLVVFHGSCFDGFTAAWIFRRFKGKDRMFQGHEVEYFPAFHGSDKLPDTKGRHVWFLDFTYSKKIMMDLIVASKRTTIYDHHKSAKADLENIILDIQEERNVLRKNDKVLFDSTRSGAGITFDELEREHGLKYGGINPRFNDRRSVWLVDYVEDRDIWKNELPDTEEVSAYLSIVPMTFEAWDEVQKIGVEDIVKAGSAIKKYIDAYGASARGNVRWEQLGQYKVPTINIPYMSCSEHIGTLAIENPKAPFAVGYFRTSSGKWKISLRSRGDFDVSALAVTYGGGGHAGAAGFEVDNLPWEKNKYLDPEFVVKIETENDKLAMKISKSKQTFFKTDAVGTDKAKVTIEEKFEPTEDHNNA
jgi:oligoribonuclease NrnB/cAMP/cGMP phosphodiesterase (DHH superfamily)